MGHLRRTGTIPSKSNKAPCKHWHPIPDKRTIGSLWYFLCRKLLCVCFETPLCGSDGINRIETCTPCTDVLDTGEYVSLTMLDRRVTQIYVSTDRRTLLARQPSVRMYSANSSGAIPTAEKFYSSSPGP